MNIKGFTQKDRYGNSLSIEFFEDNTIPSMIEIPQPDSSIFKPKGPDTVPAMLTPGEFVMNAEATRMFEPEIEAMNNAGREVQESQGGTIPEGGTIPGEPVYAESGGFLSTITNAFDDMMLPTPPKGIEYRRMKDGGIGMFAGNIYRGKYQPPKAKRKPNRDTFDFSSLYKATGGPAYLEAGGDSFQRKERPSWLTDELLDSLKGVESSGDINALSEKGAAGLYQIMPDTAANPGYFTQPITEADRYDPIKSREFADQYLSGIAFKNPDFTKDQVLQAYHSGVGNVKKAALDPNEPGYEALGPRGEVYADKVNAGVSEEPSMLSSVLDAINPISEAQASTLVPEMTDIPEEDEGSFFDFLKPDPERQAKRDAKNAEFNRKATQLNRDAVAADFKAMEAKRLANLEAGRDEFDNINEKTYNGLKEATQFQNNEAAEALNESLDKGKVDGPLANAALLAEEEKAAASLAPSESELEIIKSDGYQDHVARAQAAGQIPRTPDEWIALHTDNAEDSEGNPSAPIDRIAIGENDIVDANKEEVATAKANEAASKAAQSVVDETEPLVDKMTPEGEQSIKDLLDSLKDDDDKNDKVNKVVDTVKGWFSSMFSDLFSGPELARLMVMYAGSRVMGYDHFNSLNYSMKQYIARVDAGVATREKFVNSAEAIENYTAESLAEYRKTGDRSKLIGKDLGVKKTAGNIYMPGVGKMQVFADKNGKEYIEFEGDLIAVDQVRGLVEPWDEDVHGDKALTSAFKDSIADDVAVINSEFGFKDEDKLVVRETDIASRASGIMRNIMRRNAVSINESEDFKVAIRGGINDFLRAKAEAKKNGTEMPMSLEAFIERRSYQPLTGINQAQVNNTSVKNLRSLNTMIKREMFNKKASDPAYNKEYKADWQATYNAYKKLDPKVQAEFEADAARKGEWNGFTLWMSKTPADEIVKILQQQ